MVLVKETFEHAVQDIAKEISLLHKLSNNIRRASRESQNSKAANLFKIKDKEGNDLELFLCKFFAGNILDQFPGISEGIQNRLVSTMLLRRKRILYRRYRYAKTPIRPMQTVPQPISNPHSAQPQITMHPNHHKESKESENSLSTAKLSPSILHSQASKATTLAADKFQKASSPSVASATKTVALDDHENLIFPSPPRVKAKQIFKQPEAGPEETTSEVICPFCFYTLSIRDVSDEKKWRFVYYYLAYNMKFSLNCFQ